MMFASSQTDKGRAQQMSDSVKEAFETGGAAKAMVHEILGGTVDYRGQGNRQMKGPGGSQEFLRKTPQIPTTTVEVTSLLPSMKHLTQSLAQEIRDGKVDVHLEQRGLVISLRQAAYFPSGGDELDRTTFDSIAKIASTIQGVPNPLRIEGHTDSVPIHNEHFRSNWELSAARAITMMELLSTRYGIPRERFGISGFADTMPTAPNNTPEGKAHNRRVDIVILNQTVVVKEGDRTDAP